MGTKVLYGTDSTSGRYFEKSTYRGHQTIVSFVFVYRGAITD